MEAARQRSTSRWEPVPLSGALADYGPPGDKAANVALDQINKAIKEAGVDHTVKLVTEDNCRR